jgi:hypothetical protein
MSLQPIFISPGSRNEAVGLFAKGTVSLQESIFPAIRLHTHELDCQILWA